MIVEQTKRNENIEVLRGIAIIMVVLFHFLYRFYVIYDINPVCNNIFIKNFGTLGVSIFLVITGMFIVSCKSEGFFVKPFLNRVLKLWPTYAVGISIIFLVTRFFPLDGRTVSFCSFVSNFFFINGFVGIPYVDSAHWYLTIILSVYFIMSLFHKFKIEEKNKFYFLWLLITGALYIFSNINFSINVFNMIIGGLFTVAGGSRVGFVIIGIYIMRLYKNKNNFFECVLMMFASMLHILFLNGKGMFLEAVIVIMIMALALCGGQIHSRILLYFGTISYSVFIIHQNIGYILIKYLYDATHISYILCSLLAITASFGLGSIMYFFVEKPSKKFIKLFTNR